jgi:hypothetical protein
MEANSGALGQTVEFSAPVYDIIAPDAFGGATGPAMLFLIDFSIESVSMGFTFQCLALIRAALGSLSDVTRVGLATMGGVVTVYDLIHATECIVADLSDPVLPGQLTPPLGECRKQFTDLLTRLMNRSQEAISTGHCFGSALVVCQHALASIGGIVVACLAGPPTVGPLSIRRCDRSLKPSDDEVGRSFRELGFSLNRAGISVHLFNLQSRDPTDLATISLVAGLTGGELHFYETFDPARIHTDLFGCISGSYLWQTSLRLRATRGIKILTVAANCSCRDKTVHFPVLSSQHSVALDFAVDPEISGQRAVFQCACLFTNSRCQRIIRVMTFALPVAYRLDDVRRGVDEAALAAFLVKRCPGIVIGQGVREASSSVRLLLNTMLAKCFQFECFPYLVHSLLGSELLRHDAKLVALMSARTYSLVNCLLYLYPRLFAVDTADGPLPLVQESFGRGRVFLAHTVDRLFVWVSPECPQDVVAAFFGREGVVGEVPQLETEESRRINEMIGDCYALSGRYLPVEVIPPGSQREAVFAQILVDGSVAAGTNMDAFLRETAVAFC